MGEQIKSAGNSAVKKVVNDVTKDLPRLVKENRGAAIGAVLGYLLSDALTENEGIVTALVGGLVGKTIDDNSKEKQF